MHGPPEIETPGLTGKVSTGRELVRRAADAQVISPLPPPWQAIGDVSRKVVMDARWKAYAETLRAPAEMRERLLGACSRTVLNAAKVHIARVRMESARFDFDDDGAYALLAPIYEHGDIVDLASFDMADDTKRRTYGVGRFAVGLEDATWDAQYHPERRLLVHATIWSWLRCECVGVVPIDWQQFALHVKREGLDLVVDNDIEGRKVKTQIRRALQVPELYVRQMEATG